MSGFLAQGHILKETEICTNNWTCVLRIDTGKRFTAANEKCEPCDQCGSTTFLLILFPMLDVFSSFFPLSQFLFVVKLVRWEQTTHMFLPVCWWGNSPAKKAQLFRVNLLRDPQMHLMYNWLDFLFLSLPMSLRGEEKEVCLPRLIYLSFRKASHKYTHKWKVEGIHFPGLSVCTKF